MVKDIFGTDRYHCTIPGCQCSDFQSEAQKDIELTERDGLDMQMLESRYHGMTCQAKSMYQLTCVCGHKAESHSQKRPEASSQAAPGYFSEEPGTWSILRGVCFRKDGQDPETALIKKSKRAVGETLLTTGRCWRGPSGGVWAELDASHGGGWALIEGPGFGVEGPLMARRP
eukprot:TRINITY_DN113575_c0_g1_i1.p1 TRINITY_DN113575_c0_g1~~TRINITY_DN113575_c0_g1_i1.p1  ORF type:complete len:172 (-),score=37.90 TRINITY_DN113575_c0_g1_i1:1-516(-)